MVNAFRSRGSLKKINQRLFANDVATQTTELAVKRLTVTVETGYMAEATYDPAGIVEQVIGLTAAQTMTNKTLTNPILTVTTVSGLPAGTTGMVSIVTDANATTQNSIVAGSGSNTVLVFYDGTNWRIA